VIGFIVWFIPPKHVGIVLMVITGISVVTYIASSYFFSKKRQVMITSFIALTLCMSYLLGFHVLNTLLLLSFIIVVAKLFPNKKKIE